MVRLPDSGQHEKVWTIYCPTGEDDFPSGIHVLNLSIPFKTHPDGSLVFVEENFHGVGVHGNVKVRTEADGA